MESKMTAKNFHPIWIFTVNVVVFFKLFSFTANTNKWTRKRETVSLDNVLSNNVIWHYKPQQYQQRTNVDKNKDGSRSRCWLDRPSHTLRLFIQYIKQNICIQSQNKTSILFFYSITQGKFIPKCQVFIETCSSPFYVREFDKSFDLSLRQVNHPDFIRKSKFISPMKPERKDNWKINVLKSDTISLKGVYRFLYLKPMHLIACGKRTYGFWPLGCTHFIDML